MLRCILLLTAVLGANAYSVQSNDIVYTKDGDVFEGQLLERDFRTDHYKIELADGHITQIAMRDIEFIERDPRDYYPVSKRHLPKNTTPIGSIYIGTSLHTLTTESGINTHKASYAGVNLAGQLNINRYFALYADVNIAQYSKLTIDNGLGDRMSESGSNLPNESYTSRQLAIIASTNLYDGWQFFSGLGGYSENYTTSRASFDASGGTVQLGLGYSWQSFQLLARAMYLFSPDYTENVSTSTTAHIQMGFNF